MPGRQGLILALAAACIPAGCGAGASTHHDGASAALDASSRDSAGIRILELSHTLEAIATGGVRAATVAPDLRVGESDADWLGAPTDVASLGAGRFAVFDRMQKAILLFDSAGAPAGRLGREGGAPGEYHEPLALAAVGDHLVAWQDQPTSTFTVLGPDGVPRATGGASVAGDWGRPRHRMPYLDMRGGRDGPEDLTRRLAAVGDTAFAHLVQVDERQHEGQEAPFSWSSPPAFLIRYGLDARVRDTLAVLAGAPTLRSEQDATARATGATLRQTMWTQPLFSGRPVWAAGNGWLALGHGDSSHVEVRGLAGETLLRVRWPAARSLVTDTARIEAAIWTVAYRVLDTREAWAFFERETRKGWAEGVASDAENYLSFAEQAPTITAAFGAGACLFLAGFAPRDWVDGTSLTWVAVNVESAEVEAVFRLAPPVLTLKGRHLRVERRGGAVSEIDGRFAFVIARNDDGAFVVQRYPLPLLRCAR